MDHVVRHKRTADHSVCSRVVENINKRHIKLPNLFLDTFHFIVNFALASETSGKAEVDTFQWKSIWSIMTGPAGRMIQFGHAQRKSPSF